MTAQEEKAGSSSLAPALSGAASLGRLPAMGILSCSLIGTTPAVAEQASEMPGILPLSWSSPCPLRDCFSASGVSCLLWAGRCRSNLGDCLNLRPGPDALHWRHFAAPRTPATWHHWLSQPVQPSISCSLRLVVPSYCS